MTTSTACRYWLAALAAGFVSLSGCHTPQLDAEPQSYEDPLDRLLETQVIREQPYDEAVSGFLITEDQTKLIVLGRPVHFVLTVPDTLRSALSSSYRKSLQWTFVGFRAVGGHVEGRYRVVLPRGASARDRLAAAIDGFADAQDGVALEGRISGMRYSTQGFDVPSGMTAQLLDRPYTIHARHVTMAIAGLNLAMQFTPIAVTDDGELALDGTKLVPLTLFVIQASRE